MSHHNNVVALDLPIPEIKDMPEDTQKYFQICQEKLGMIPNVLTAYSQNLKQLELQSIQLGSLFHLHECYEK